LKFCSKIVTTIEYINKQLNMRYLGIDPILGIVDNTNIPDKSSCAVIVLNPSLDRFIKVFTKFEVVTAFEYLADAILKYAIPVFVASKKYDNAENFSDKRKSDQENQNFKSRYDDEFITRYTKILSTLPVQRYEYSGYDAFSAGNLSSAISESRKDNILICGTWLETDIIGSVFGSFKLSVKPIVVSDACSSESERIFYESLDVLSRVTRIIDTRDLLKEWG
jgi:nicotinamidase-related amidase